MVYALVDAYGPNANVQVLVDDKGTQGRSSLIAIKLIADASIPIRTISDYAMYQDKYLVVDGRTTETSSFNYSQAVARSNSEKVMVVWDDSAAAAAAYLRIGGAGCPEASSARISFTLGTGSASTFGQSIKELDSRRHLHNEERVKTFLCSLSAVEYRQSPGLGLGLAAYQVLVFIPAPVP